MDHALVEFRKAAARENRGRRGLQRRYSLALQAQAVEYWRMRQSQGDHLRGVAAALGVAWVPPHSRRSATIMASTKRF